MAITNQLDDNNVAMITQFMDIDTYNSIPQVDKNHMRLLFENLYDGLIMLKQEGVNEISFNSDGKLWAYGAVSKTGKLLVGIKRPEGVPMYDTTQKEKVIKKYLVKTDNLGRKQKIAIDKTYHITEMDEIKEEVEENFKKIEKDPNGIQYLDHIDADKVIKTLSTLYRVQVHELNPILEVEIPYIGYRFSGMMPPCQQKTGFSIRTKPKKIFSLDDYIEQGTITESQKKSIYDAIQNRKNILVVGGTSSGKTTFCNAILKATAELDPLCRMIIIEDLRELQCSVEDLEYFTVPPPSTMKTDDLEPITTARLLKAAMRRTPNRICVGEVRDGDTAMNLLSAWNSGHPGGVCTIHADNAIGGLDKMEQYIEMANKTPNKVMLAKTINVIISIQQGQVYDKTEGKWKTVRKVEEIKSVDDYYEATKQYALTDM